MNKAWEAMMRVDNPKYKGGGKVKESIDPSSLEEVAHKDYDSGLRQALRYTAKTYGGDQRNIIRDIKGLNHKKDRRELAVDALRHAIKTNPSFDDTVSVDRAKEFMNYEQSSLWDLIKGLIGPAQYAKGGKIKKGYHT